MPKLTIPERKDLRLKQWQHWLSRFMASNAEFELIPHAAELVNTYYWKLALTYLKPLLEYSDGEEEHNLHYYKIISASELSIMAVCPITHATENEQVVRKKNAEFAWFVALTILVNWKIDNNDLVNKAKLNQIINEQEPVAFIDNDWKFYPTSFKDEHIQWLFDLNTASTLPVLSNSQTWRMLFFASRI